MNLEATSIPGAFLIVTEPIHDERGFFTRTYCSETFRKAGAPFGSIRQTSISFNTSERTLRGMHWQNEPASEGKVVRVMAGRIFDVIVDLRDKSPRYLKWFGVELSSGPYGAILVPPGCAHGFVTLEPNCTVEYQMDTVYEPGLARGFRWDDPAVGIQWPEQPKVVSERDRNWPDLTT